MHIKFKINEKNEYIYDGVLTNIDDTTQLYDSLQTRFNGENLHPLLGELISSKDKHLYLDFAVNLTNVSHTILNLRLNEANEVEGTIKILDTPSGKILKYAVENGSVIEIVTRLYSDKIKLIFTFDLKIYL
jgi:hypothetical protein